jgi:uncharacterized protein (TIGR03067 family)
MLQLVCLLSMICTKADEAPKEAQKELEKLQGTWRLVSGEESGDELTPEAAKRERMQFIFKGETLIIKHKDQVIEEFSVTVDPSKDPKQIDLRFTKGDDKGKICLGIYSIDGDQMKICTNTKLHPTTKEKRPNVFSTKDSREESKIRGLMLCNLERQK